MKNKNRVKYLWILIVAIGVLNSCNKDNYNFDLSKVSSEGSLKPLIAVPLVDASITLKELIPDDPDVNRYLLIDEKNFITIAFNSNFAAYTIDDFMNGAPLSGSSLPLIQYQIDPQVVDLGLDGLISEGSIHIANPKITVKIKNYWDVPAKFKFVDFFYYETETSAPLPVTGSLFSEWITVNPPSTFGGFANTEILVDTSNTNFDEAISALPNKISFGAAVETTPGNPYNLPSGTTDSVSLSVQIPLDFSLSKVLITDTISFGLGNTDTSLVQSIKLNLLAENGFPLGIKGQIYLVDSNYVVLDSLFDTKLLELNPAEIQNGTVSQTTNSENTILIESNRMSNVFKAKYLIPKVYFSTTNNSDVKLYSNYSFGLKLGALLQLKVDLNSSNN